MIEISYLREKDKLYIDCDAIIAKYIDNIVCK